MSGAPQFSVDREALRKIRQSAMLTQIQLSERAGLSKALVGEIERGDRSLTTRGSTIEKLAKALTDRMRETGAIAEDEHISPYTLCDHDRLEV